MSRPAIIALILADWTCAFAGRCLQAPSPRMQIIPSASQGIDRKPPMSRSFKDSPSLKVLRKFLLAIQAPCVSQICRGSRIRLALRPPKQFDDKDSGLRNINRVGPSKKREEEIRKALAKAKQDREQQSFANDESQESSQRDQPNSDFQRVQESMPLENRSVIGSNSDRIVSPPKTTSGIGGSWSENASAGTKTYKPTTSGSWGVFDRPKDISKAFGGGRRIGIGGYTVDEEEKKRKQAETDRLLKRYLQKKGLDMSLEDQHREEILAAREEAQELMASQRASEAVAVLEQVSGYLNLKTELSADTLFDLATALQYANRWDEAKNVFKKLAQHKITKYSVVARSPGDMEQAEKFMKFDKDTGPSEWDKLLGDFRIGWW